MTTIDIAEDIIETYELDYGNSETFVQGNNVFVTVEAPNHATIGVAVPNRTDRIGLARRLAYEMDSFDADEEFDELWSKEFAGRNHFTPSGFLRMLEEDQEYFDKTADALRGEHAVDQKDISEATIG